MLKTIVEERKSWEKMIEVDKIFMKAKLFADSLEIERDKWISLSRKSKFKDEFQKGYVEWLNKAIKIFSSM